MLWLLPICFFIPAGIVVGSKISLPLEVFFWFAFVLILLCLLLTFLNFPKTCLILIWIIFFTAGAISIKNRIKKTADTPEIFNIEGNLVFLKVNSFPEFKKNYTTFSGKVLKIFDNKKILNPDLNILINLEGQMSITYGQCIIARIQCREPNEFGVPGISSSKENFSYMGIKFICSADLSNVITGIIHCDNFYVTALNKLNKSIKQYITEKFPTPESGFFLAITTGDRSKISDELLNVFRNSGTAHLLAISGLHVGIAGVFIYFLFRTIFKLNHKLLIYLNVKCLSAIFTIPFLFLFCVVAGMSPSTLRALIMALLILLSTALLKRPLTLYITCLTWSLMLILDPASLFDLSFQLSFSAVFSIVLFYSQFNIKKYLQTNHYYLLRVLYFVVGNLMTSIAGFLGTAGIVARTFKTIPLLFVPANFIAVPLTSIIIPSMMLCLCLWWLPSDINPFILLITILTKVLLGTIYFLGNSDYATLNITPPDNFRVVIYYLILTVFFIKISWRFKFLLILILVIIVSLKDINLNNNERMLKVTFIDVGQGDSTLIEFPDGRNMLVDCGPEYMDFNAGERIVAPFLWYKRIKKINTLVMTHQQSDHAGGCPYIIQRFKVDEIWVSDTDWNFEGFNLKNTAVIKLHNKIIKNSNKLKITSLNSVVNNKSDDNNNSVALKIEYNMFAILLTGDIGNEVEKILPGDLTSTVLKVPHHGSCTSSSEVFLKSVNPEMAVISAGRRNRFNHPCEKTIRRLRNSTDKIYITASDGTITVSSDGENYCYSTYFNPEKRCEKIFKNKKRL